MTGDRKPTYDELAALVVQQAAVIDALTARVADLERQLGMNSRNSSKPPSTEGLAKPAPKPLRKKTGRKPGGQEGHRGATLTQSPTPDVVVTHSPDVRTDCGEHLTADSDTSTTVRQVFDLPEIHAEITEHCLTRRQCSCGCVTDPDAPTGVNAPVQYGPRVKAAMVNLTCGQFVSITRTAELLTDMLGIPVSTGSVASAQVAAAEGLDPVIDTIAAGIVASPVVHADETGLRVAGKLHWGHSLSTDTLSLVNVHPKRGREGIEAVGVIPALSGTLVHDAWAPYFCYDGVDHQLCAAHVHRELISVIDHYEHATGSRHCWAQQVLTALLAVQKEVARVLAAGGAAVDAGWLDAKREFISLSARAGARSSVPGKVGTKHRALGRRIDRRCEEYLLFATPAGIAAGVPPDNNAAEREVRMMKFKQKVSGCCRTLSGARVFMRVRSYVQTARKQSRSVFGVLTDLFSGRAWLPTVPA